MWIEEGTMSIGEVFDAISSEEWASPFSEESNTRHLKIRGLGRMHVSGLDRSNTETAERSDAKSQRFIAECDMSRRIIYTP